MPTLFASDMVWHQRLTLFPNYLAQDLSSFPLEPESHSFAGAQMTKWLSLMLTTVNLRLRILQLRAPTALRFCPVTGHTHRLLDLAWIWQCVT